MMDFDAPGPIEASPDETGPVETGPVDTSPVDTSPVEPIADELIDGSAEAAANDDVAALVDEPSFLADRRQHSKRALEALICVTEDPADSRLLAQLLEIPVTLVDELCRELADEYAEQRRGFQMVRVAGGWRFQSHPDMAAHVEQFVLVGQSSRLSNAALESLAIIAYKQPISRAQIAAIRGVNADGVIRTLSQRGYITEVARDPGPGQASLYGTTRLFLERLGIDSLADLPAVADFVPGGVVVESLEQGLRFDDLEDALTIEHVESPTPSNEALPGFDVDEQ